jgi:mRNA interferase MazF
MASGIARGDIRLYKFSHPDKERPVLVLTRDSVIPRLSKVTIVPISSSMRGAVSEVMLTEDDGMRQPCCLNLHNLITVESRN